MIYLAHVDPTRPAMIVQANYLKKSHQEVNIKEPLIFLKKDQRLKYSKYGCVDNYPVYNRYISVIEYVKDNKLFDEVICILDCDMYFQKQYTPLPVKFDEIVSQEWVGGQNWTDYWAFFTHGEFKEFSLGKSNKFNFKNPNNKLQVPFYMRGETLVDLFYTSLYFEKILRKKTTWWMTEMLCTSYASWYLNLNLKYDTLGAARWNTEDQWYSDKNAKETKLENYVLIHYANNIEGFSGPSNIEKKYMHDSKKMLEEIEKFVSTDKPKTDWDKSVLDFFIKTYNYRGKDKN